MSISIQMSDVLSAKNKCTFIGAFGTINEIPKEKYVTNNIAYIKSKNNTYIYTGEMWVLFIDDITVRQPDENMILQFIFSFTKNNDIVIRTFTEGYCYWFAVILKERFNGQIVYNPEINHFACNIFGKIYDATGVDNINKYYDWEEYKLKDSNETARLYQNCILKYPDDWEIDYKNNTCNGYPLKLYNY